MNELAMIKETIDSREIAEMLGKKHEDVLTMIQGRGKNLGIMPVLETGKFTVSDYFIESSYQAGTNNKSYKCYEVTKMGCEMIGNKLQGEKGILFTATYVKRFNDMENKLKLNSIDSYMIEDPIARARKWIEEETERLNLKIVAEEQQKEIAVLAPKAAFADSVAASSDTILLRELAKLIKQNGFAVGEQRLKEKLRNYGYLIKNELAPDYNLPTQRSMELKLFVVKQTTINSSSGSVHITNTVRVTPKGVQYIMDKFLTGKIVV